MSNSIYITILKSEKETIMDNLMIWIFLDLGLFSILFLILASPPVLCTGYLFEEQVPAGDGA